MTIRPEELATLDCLASAADPAPLPLHGTSPAGLAALCAQLPPAAAAYLAGSGFTGKAQQLALLPGAAGLAGAVRIAKDGQATLVLAAGPGKVGYRKHVIESPVPFAKSIVAGKQLEKIPAPTLAIDAQSPAITV